MALHLHAKLPGCIIWVRISQIFQLLGIPSERQRGGMTLYPHEDSTFYSKVGTQPYVQSTPY
jgi:hypothetical protein